MAWRMKYEKYASKPLERISCDTFRAYTAPITKNEKGPDMTRRADDARILIYSHDSFGLGHLRRCRTIAHALVERYKGLSVLILSGSPIIGSFDFKARVDFVRIPGVIKLHNGGYTSLALHIDIEQTLKMREAIIYHTAESFRPDIFLVDKEPPGLKGEVRSTLKLTKSLGAVNILGLRDVMDDPVLLQQEWERKNVEPVLQEDYDEIWVYGPRQMGSPLQGVGVATEIEEKLRYTGFLKRELPTDLQRPLAVKPEKPYILVTTGGGNDGEEVVDWVISACEQHTVDYNVLIVLGPFMPIELQEQFQQRVEQLAHVELLLFDNSLEFLINDAEGVVAMGGYNTFCEMLSFNKRALIIPRTKPRREQLIRAQKAALLGLVSVLRGDGERCSKAMAKALNALPHQSLPSEHLQPGMLEGLDSVADFVWQHIQHAE